MWLIEKTRSIITVNEHDGIAEFLAKSLDLRHCVTMDEEASTYSEGMCSLTDIMRISLWLCEE